jgi:methionyl-tRNA synthetase
MKKKSNKSEKVIKNTFYITTPIYYTNSSPHIGSAYTTIAADVLARWNKLLGKDVFFLTGTDEHGQKIQETAEKSNVDPQKFVDQISSEFRQAFKMLNIQNTNFIRTTDKAHIEEVKELLNKLYSKNLIYKGFYESYYCVGCEQYLTETDLVDGKCVLHNREPELKKEEAYLFKLSKFQKPLLNLIKKGEYNILPEVKRKEIINFIESGLKDVSISRLKEKISWGIELPFDKKHTCWVWPDAFWNYVSGLKQKGKEEFNKFWPVDVQLMARDILRVHATIWPALLLGAEYPLPKTLFIHGYFTIEGKKMSKSLGNVISPVYLVEKYGADSVRYYLMRNLPFGSDGDVSENGLILRHNNELADKLGNLVSRVSALVEKYGLEKCENNLISKLDLKKIEDFMNNFQLDRALNELFSFVDSCNEYVQEKKPWEEKCSNKKEILFELVEGLKIISVLLWPFMPNTSEKIAGIFGFKLDYSEINSPTNYLGIKKAEPIFKKIEIKKEVTNNIKVATPSLENIQDISGQIKPEDFLNVDLRVGTIIDVEDVEGADKLLKLTVDTGENRTILAGIKKFYSKEELKARQIIVICNLEPRILRGIKSEGMLLAAVSEDHNQVVLMKPQKKVKSGSRVEFKLMKGDDEK